ncbi:g1671 [Coccomyxa elongata]
MGRWDRHHLIWGFLSIVHFMYYVLVIDQSFQSWGDVYYFCGEDMRFCTCEFKWNLAGWGKALTLWNFILSSALGLQKLAIRVGMDGLLPGEEVVTKESFISVCWRLIPYWLNNWEQKWGAECSSMMFELPHFAMELLVVLPCVQILCARLKILAMPPGRAVVQHGEAAAAEVEPDLAPCILRGGWAPGPEQRKLLPRLRANVRVLAVVVAVAAVAASNALLVPLRLEHQIEVQPRSPGILAAHHAGLFTAAEGEPWRLRGPLEGLGVAYQQKGCDNMELLQRKLQKHGAEMARMRGREHRELIPLVEIALAIMRLSCEKFFVLISVLASYLIFRDDVPRSARLLIRLNHKLSTLFQRVILYSFPAICWLYGAGFVFSTFVSVVFWGASVQQLWESLRKHSTIVRPMGLQDATEEQIERMNNNCAVCWSEMGAPMPRAPMLLMGAGGPGLAALHAAPAHAPGKSLLCGHAFHEACIKQWLVQCHGQGRQPTCPMCNAVIELEVLYRLPIPWTLRQPHANVEPAQDLLPHAQVNGDVPQQQPDNEWFEVMEEIAVGGHANELGGPQLGGQ